jgi:hypothetical protein
VLPKLRDMLENHRLELEEGAPMDQLAHWMATEHPDFDPNAYGFQAFSEFLNFAQDKTVVRLEPNEERGFIIYLGPEFYPPAEPPKPEPKAQQEEEEDDGPQPYVEGQPTIMEPNPPPPKPRKAPARKRAAAPRTTTRPRKRKTD